MIRSKALQVQPMPTSCTLPCGALAATVFAIPRITIAGHGAMYGSGPPRRIWKNGFDDMPLKVAQCFTQLCLFADSKRVPDGIPRQHRTYRHWPAWKPVWLPQLQGQLGACVHGRGHVPIHVHKRGQMVPSFVRVPPPWDTHIAEERDNNNIAHVGSTSRATFINP